MAGGLKRRIGPLLLTAYGLGVMVGAGIYVLIGTVAASAGIWAPAAFLAAGLIAALSALSYAEFATRVPEAAGAASYIEEGLGLRWLGLVAGLAVALSGMVSAAAVLKGGVGYLVGILPLPELPAILVLGAALTFVAILGVLESLSLAALLTAIEVIGLLIAGWAGFSAEPAPDWQSPAPPVWSGLAAATALAFFAFIGFEDTYNVAEEVKDPERTIPLALVSAMLLATVLYIAVAISAVSVVPYHELAAAPAPLAAVMETAAPAFPAIALIAITMFAVGNTALVNYVTASRMLYGMSRQGLLPASVGRVHATRHTPHIAVLILLAVLAPLMLSAGIRDLAAATVLLLLFAFAIVNASLVVLKRRPGEPEGHFELPLFVPLVGCLLCVGLILVRVASSDIKAPLIAGVLIAGILAIYWLLGQNTKTPPA